MDDRSSYDRRIEFTEREIDRELDRVCGFLRTVLGDERALVGVSGGVDSDVVARLAARVLPGNRLKIVFVDQDDMDPRHRTNAEQLAEDLEVPLTRLNLRGLQRRLMAALHEAEPTGPFHPDGLLIPSRAKCSLRTAAWSTYEDQGYLILGPSNRTELETGFFLPFGDGLAHVQPIAHLWKTQVRQLAARLGSRPKVLGQPASSGFWLGAEDLLDLAFWLFAGAPTRADRPWTAEELEKVQAIRRQLTTDGIDRALHALALGLSDQPAAQAGKFTPWIATRLRLLREFGRANKRRPLHQRLGSPTP